jgi:outer membrane protein TolC
VLADTRALTARELAAAENRYRAAQETQRNLLRARQALARVNEREPMLRALAARNRAQLARWIGAEAQLPLPDGLPPLAAVPPALDVTRHPDWRAADAGREVAHAEVDIQRQEYKPGVMLDLMYGFREERPDMLTALVSVDLPLFRSKRQDQKLAEKQAMAAAASYEAEDKRRELEAMFTAAQAEYQAANERARIFTEQLLPAIRRETQLSVAGFAREQTDTREARMKELDAQLELLRAQVDAAKAQAELLYLLGDDPS